MWFVWINIVVSCWNIIFSEEFCVLSNVCLWKAINMLRFFSRRKPKGRKDQRYGSGGGYSNVGNGTSRKPLGPTSKHKMLDCKVIFLDGEDETFPITVSSHWLLKSSSFYFKIKISMELLFELFETLSKTWQNFLENRITKRICANI